MTPRQKIEALLARFEPEIRDAFLAAIADVVDTVILQQVIDAVERGDAVAVFEALGLSPASMRPLSAAIEGAYEQAGNTAGEMFNRARRPLFRFDVRNTRAENWLRNQSSQLITRISEDTRINVMSVLDEGMRAGRNPRTVALDIVGRLDPGTRRREGGIVGLSQANERWARSARNKLLNLDEDYFTMDLRDKRFDGTVQAAIDAGKPLSLETVDKLVTRYKDNALRYRGEMIARTEAIAALNQSEYEATKQAVESGKVKSSQIKREWDTAGDKNVRHSHKMLDGKRVAVDEPFVLPARGIYPEIRAMFPGDTSLGAPASFVSGCRCRVRTVVDFLSGFK